MIAPGSTKLKIVIQYIQVHEQMWFERVLSHLEYTQEKVETKSSGRSFKGEDVS